MEANIKKLIENISPKSTRKIIEDHTKEVIIDNNAKSVNILIDRKHALNKLSSNDHIGNLIKGVKSSFGGDYEAILKVKNQTDNQHHDREMNIPHVIHYN